MWRVRKSGLVNSGCSISEGALEAVIDDYHIAKSFESRLSEVKVAAEIPDTKCQYAMMFAKGNDDLRNAVNAALNEIRINDDYDKFFRKWLVTTNQRISPK